MIQRPRGTRDFGPDEMERRRYFEFIMREQCHRFGFREIATPIFEHTELFTTKSGPGIVEELYSFKDKGDRDIALRPELTASVVRFFVNELATLPRPLKVFYFGQMFRYERPQSGRYREFFQFGAELFGNPLPESDAEVIGLACSMLERTGLQEYQVRIGHIGILRGKLTDAGIAPEAAQPILQKLDKKAYPEAEELMRAAGVDAEHMQEIVRITGTIGGAEVLDGFEGEAAQHLRQVISILASYGYTKVKIDLGVVRGLAYYTGMVFEADAPKLGAEKQICGGGSYSLSELFGGEKVFSTGFAIGFDRTLLAIEKEGSMAPAFGLDAYVVATSDAMRPTAFQVVAELRRSGLMADVDLMRRSLGKNFKYADAVHVRRVVIIGEKEMEQGSATIRDMATGQQTLVPLEELARALLKMRE
ncbi:MAG: histidine--tRNA ligase [Methanomassiliicoccales archaeon]